MSDPSGPVLFCTVGGRHEPIVSALRSRPWAHVVFICSAAAPGSESSRSMIDDRVEVGHGAEKRIRPPIPVQADLPADGFQVVEVPADDPDRAIELIGDCVAGLRRDRPDANLVADFTGGTKSMSAALMHAAFAAGVPLQLMVGDRDNLSQVKDGTERPVHVSLELAAAQRRVERLVDAWKAYGYDEAAAGLAELHEDPAVAAAASAAFRNRVAALLDLSRAFAAWDRFDHAGARGLLAPLAARHPPIGPYCERAALLADDTGREPAVLFDLWDNAMRAAARGRYDDATARLYRLLEWTAQWLLRTRLGVDTGDVDVELIRPLNAELAASLEADRSEEGKIQIPLGRAWSVVEKCLKDRPIRDFMRSKRHKVEGKTNDEHRRRWAKARNYSILAHGSRPIDRARWETEILPFPERFMAALRWEVAADHPGLDCLQLPTAPPPSV